MADTKTDSSSTPLSDDPANPTKGLSAKPNTASHPAGAEPALDTLFHRTSLRFCCAANVGMEGEAREPDVYRVSSNRLTRRRPPPNDGGGRLYEGEKTSFCFSLADSSGPSGRGARTAASL